MNRSSVDYLQQMREHMQHALALVAGIGKENFRSDRRTHQAVLLSLLIIGEAAAKIVELYPDVTRRYQDIPWRSIRGMRNRIAHDYFSIDLDIVWETLQEALPKLLQALDGPSG